MSEFIKRRDRIPRHVVKLARDTVDASMSFKSETDYRRLRAISNLAEELWRRRSMMDRRTLLLGGLGLGGAFAVKPLQLPLPIANKWSVRVVTEFEPAHLGLDTPDERKLDVKLEAANAHGWRVLHTHDGAGELGTLILDKPCGSAEEAFELRGNLCSHESHDFFPWGIVECAVFGPMDAQEMRSERIGG